MGLCMAFFADTSSAGGLGPTRIVQVPEIVQQGCHVMNGEQAKRNAESVLIKLFASMIGRSS